MAVRGSELDPIPCRRTRALAKQHSCGSNRGCEVAPPYNHLSALASAAHPGPMLQGVSWGGVGLSFDLFRGVVAGLSAGGWRMHSSSPSVVLCLRGSGGAINNADFSAVCTLFNLIPSCRSLGMGVTSLLRVT